MEVMEALLWDGRDYLDGMVEARRLTTGTEGLAPQEGSRPCLLGLSLSVKSI